MFIEMNAGSESDGFALVGQLMANDGADRRHFLRQRQIQRMAGLNVILCPAVHGVPRAERAHDGDFVDDASADSA